MAWAREKEYLVYYKQKLLKHKFYADFVLLDKIILEIKCVKAITDEHISQAINYLKVSGNKLVLLINFGGVNWNIKELYTKDKWNSCH